MGCHLLNVPRLFPDDELLSRSELTGTIDAAVAVHRPGPGVSRRNPTSPDRDIHRTRTDTGVPCKPVRCIRNQGRNHGRVEHRKDQPTRV